MTIAEYKQTPYYTLEPHAHTISPGSGHIPIEEIATRVYDKPYNSLRGCQYDNENLPNDSVALYHLTDDDDFEELLGQFDDTEMYLGWDKENNRGVYRWGLTPLEYWLTIKVANRPEEVTVDANPPKYADLEGAVFSDRHYADRAFTPSLGAVLADLIRRGELPRGDYIYRHWW